MAVMDSEAAAAEGSGQFFIGRVGEIARLRGALDDARAGRGSLILLAGPPGIGKSRLAAKFSRVAAGEGFKVLVGRSWEAGGAPPYWPWVQAIRSQLSASDRAVGMGRGDPGLSEMAALLPELAGLGSRAVSAAELDPVVERFRLFDATAGFLRSLAEEEPLVILLDDLQAADVPSLLLLQFVTDQIAASHIVVVATYRDVEVTPDHHLSKVLAALNRAPISTTITLPGLDEHEVTRFVQASSGSLTAPAVARGLHRQTSGNPLFLSEAVRLLAAGGGTEFGTSSARLMVPTEIREVIERRLETITSSTRETLLFGSVFGNEFDIESLSRLAEASPDEVLEHMSEAIVAGLVVEAAGAPGRFRFAHDLMRHTLYAGIAPVRRIRLHRHAAEILEESYGSEVDDHLAELALHRFEAAAEGDTATAIEFGRRAGDRAMLGLAYEEAVRLYRMAIDVLEASEPHNQMLHVDMLLLLGDARVRAGDLPGAGEAFLQAAGHARSLGDPRRLAEAAVGYGGRFIWARAGGDTHMVPLLQDALVLLGGEDDSMRVRLLSRLACATRSTADRMLCAALSKQALDLARELGDPHTLIYALTGRAGAIWWPENPEERLEIGSELASIGEAYGSVEGMIDGWMTRCAALTEIGDLAAARRELDTLSRAGGPLGLPAQHWLEGAMRAWFALAEGHLDEVEQWIEGLRVQAPTTPARDNVSAALFQLFLLRREQGRLDEVEQEMRCASTDFPWYPIHRLAHAFVLVSTGNEAEARHILEQLAVDDFVTLHRDNYWLPSLCLAADLVSRLEEKSIGVALYQLLQPYAERNAVAFTEGALGPVARYLGLLAMLAGDVETAAEHLSFAESFCRRMGTRPWLAHVLFDRARLASLQGDGDDGAALAVRCLDLCRQVGLVALEREVADLGAPPPARAAPGAVSAIFRRDGDYFTVSFENDEFRIKDSKGMRYLSVLLGAPGREIHVLDLTAGVSGSARAPVGTRTSPEVNAGNEHAGPILDMRARREYHARLLDLQADIDEAEAFGDTERVSLARQESEFIAAELAAAVGLGGRDRLAVSTAEKARVNVTRAIRSTLERIAGHSSALGAHLDVTIHTGTFCSYTPDPLSVIRWRS